MLWGSMAEKAVTDSFARAKVGAELERRQDAERRIDILEDDWKDILFCKIKEIYKSPIVLDSVRGYISTEHNVFKRIVTELSTVYKWGAQREFEDPMQDGIARLMYDEVQMDESMDDAVHFLNGLRDIIIVPLVSDGKMRLEILTPDRVSVIQNPRDPTTIEAFSWEVTRSNTVATRSGFSTETFRIYIDKEVRAVWDVTKRRWIEIAPHNLGRLPAVVVHAGRRHTSFFSPTPMSDVVDATLSIGVLLVMLMHLSKYQSELQPTYSGKSQDALVGQDAGGHTMWTGPGQWGVLNLQAKPDYYINHINQRLSWISVQYGLSADAYQMTGNANSGFQFRLQKLPLLEARERQKKTWRRTERELWKVMSAVAKFEHPLFGRLDPGQTMMLNFNEAPMIEDPMVRNRIYKERIDLTLMSHIDAIMQEDPDLSREQALKKAERIRDERKLHITMFQDTNAPDDATDVGQSPQENGGKPEEIADAP